MSEFNVFIASSGPTSKAVAEAWRVWLPLVIQGAGPWMSETDIPKGSPWFGELADQLKGIKIGIICLTPDNLAAPSIHFEAGALSKTVADKAYVCPYLFNVEDSDLRFPLANFQTTKAQKADTKRLLRTLSRALATKLSDEQLDRVFEKWWPELESSLRAIAPPSDEEQLPHRNDSEIIKELLELVRNMYGRPYPTESIFVPLLPSTQAILGGVVPQTADAINIVDDVHTALTSETER